MSMGLGSPWVLNKILTYLGCVCDVISPSSYCIALKLRRLLGYENINGKKAVQSLFVVMQAVICLPKLREASPLLCVALWPPLAVAGPQSLSQPLLGTLGSPHLERGLCFSAVRHLLLSQAPSSLRFSRVFNFCLDFSRSLSLCHSEEPERCDGASLTLLLALLFSVELSKVWNQQETNTKRWGFFPLSSPSLFKMQI